MEERKEKEKEKIVIIRKNLVSCHQIVQFSSNFFSQPSQNVLKESKMKKSIALYYLKSKSKENDQKIVEEANNNNKKNKKILPYFSQSYIGQFSPVLMKMMEKTCEIHLNGLHSLSLPHQEVQEPSI